MSVKVRFKPLYTGHDGRSWHTSLEKLAAPNVGDGVVETLEFRVEKLTEIVAKLVERLPREEWLDVLGRTDLELAD